MGSGGTHCDACRKRNDRCTCLPAPVKHICPCCPWCGEEFEVAEKQEEYTTISCPCGYNFEAQRTVVFVSRPLP